MKRRVERAGMECLDFVFNFVDSKGVVLNRLSVLP
jgi:hypothetical protein